MASTYYRSFLKEKSLVLSVFRKHWMAGKIKWERLFWWEKEHSGSNDQICTKQLPLRWGEEVDYRELRLHTGDLQVASGFMYVFCLIYSFTKTWVGYFICQGSSEKQNQECVYVWVCVHDTYIIYTVFLWYLQGIDSRTQDPYPPTSRTTDTKIRGYSSHIKWLFAYNLHTSPCIL